MVVYSILYTHRVACGFASKVWFNGGKDNGSAAEFSSDVMFETAILEAAPSAGHMFLVQCLRIGKS